MTKYPIPVEAEERLPPAGTLSGKCARYLLARFPVWPIVDHLAHKQVPHHRHSAWYAMGGIALFLLAVQLATGVLLMVYYHPGQPWSSVQRIVMEVPFGNVIRSIHHWSANLMVLTLLAHVFSIFFMKAYRPPAPEAIVPVAAADAALGALPQTPPGALPLDPGFFPSAGQLECKPEPNKLTLDLVP